MNQTIKGLPLQGIRARQLIIELLAGKKFWSRADLVKAVVERHEQEGGAIGKQDPTAVVKNALSGLKEEGRVFSPSLGIWAKVGDSSESPDVGGDSAEVSEPSLETTSSDDDLGLGDLPSEKTIGAGAEAVYLYFNQSDQELAQYKNQEIWPCKIGMTTVLPVTTRIISQGVKTAFSKPPVIGLVILTENAYRMEKSLHHALHMAGAECTESLGSEWFYTNPSRIEDWYKVFFDATSKLKI